MSSPVRHYGRWRIRWIDADGKRRSEVYIKHRDAELALQRHEVEAEEIRRGSGRVPWRHTRSPNWPITGSNKKPDLTDLGTN